METQPKRQRRQDSRLHLCFTLKSSRVLDYAINCMTVGKPFADEGSDEANVLIGTEGGRVMVLQRDEEDTMLETKGGPVQSILLHDVTGFGALDLVVGDSNGTVTIFSRQQMLSKRSVGAAVGQLEIFRNAVDDFEIMAGDAAGVVTSLHSHEQFWRLSVTELSARLPMDTMSTKRSLAIRCMLSVMLPDRHGTESAYLLVCDGSPFVHVVQDGEKLTSIKIPSVINSMCAGHFRRRHRDGNDNDGDGNGDDDAQTATDGIPPGAPSSWWDKQVVLAGDDGYIYIMESETFQITKLLKIDYPVTRVSRFWPSRGGWPDATDLLLCTGHFNGVHVYGDGELVTIIETEDWVHTLAWGDVDGDGKDELVLGLLNQVVEVYEYDFRRNV